MWKEKQLKERGYHYSWNLEEALALIDNPQRIPYLGHWKGDTSYPKELPELVLSLTSKDEESELSVRNYSAMLKMLKRELQLSGMPLVRVTFQNLGTSGLRWDKCGGETPFLNILTRLGSGHDESINFVLDNPQTYHAFWSNPLTRLEQKMSKYRGPNVYA